MYEKGIINDGSRWWDSGKNDLYQNVFSYINHLDKHQQYRTSQNLRAAKLYGNYDIMGLDAHNYSRVDSTSNIKMM